MQLHSKGQRDFFGNKNSPQAFQPAGHFGGLFGID
jgi:hypothetical protein